MKLVNLNEMKIRRHRIYYQVKQPMPIYHSYQELIQNVKNPVILTKFTELVDYISQTSGSLTEDVGFVKLNAMLIDYRNKEIYLKTIDKYIPDYEDSDGVIHYTDPDNLVETDGCYVKLYFIGTSTAKILLYTSAGVFMAFYDYWNVRAATKPQYISVRTPKRRLTEEHRLDSILRRKTPNIMLLKLVFGLLSSDSETQWDIKATFKNTMGRYLPIKYLDKIIKSQAFKESVMAVIKTFYPSLYKAIRELHSPEDIANKLAETWAKASSEKGKVSEMIDVIKTIVEFGYSEVAENISTRDTLISATAEKIILPDYTQKLKPKEVLSEEDLKQIKEELDYPDGYIADLIDDYETEEENIEEQKDEQS